MGGSPAAAPGAPGPRPGRVCRFSTGSSFSRVAGRLLVACDSRVRCGRRGVPGVQEPGWHDRRSCLLILSIVGVASG
jgi:hypothetical protein